MPNDNAKIILAATNAKLSKIRDTLLVEDNINSVKCEFIFRTSDWNDTAKTAVFVRGYATPSTSSDDIIPMLLDKHNECDVPPEVLENNGTFSVGVWGSSTDYRMVSNWMYYRVADGCFAEGGTSLTPTPSVYEQILITVENHKHAEYITRDEANTVISESVSQTIDDLFGAGVIDAGPITEYSEGS